MIGQDSHPGLLFEYHACIHACVRRYYLIHLLIMDGTECWARLRLNSEWMEGVILINLLIVCTEYSVWKSFCDDSYWLIWRLPLVRSQLKEILLYGDGGL